MTKTIQTTLTAVSELQIASPLALESVAERQLPSGHRVQVDAANGCVVITNVEGLLELRVRCTAQGCVVQLGAGDLQLSSSGRIAIDCAALDVRTQNSISLRTQGELLATAEGQASLTADQLHMRASHGDAVLEANDHVRLVGEQIRLNSEQQTLGPAEEMRALWERLGIG
ncbi:MAG TPA: hypothetical protein VFN67_22710 [Polyangiales bacterium]|nr:hypothetical protein [Polyangiales bacterium]